MTTTKSLTTNTKLIIHNNNNNGQHGQQHGQQQQQSSSNKKQKLINLKLLPDYLDKIIIKSILDYLLNNKKKIINSTLLTTTTTYTIKKLNYYIDEIITICTVSKKWYSMVSSLISNSIEFNNKLNQQILRQHITYTNKDGENFKILINSNYSILKPMLINEKTIKQQIQLQQLYQKFKNSNLSMDIDSKLNLDKFSLSEKEYSNLITTTLSTTTTTNNSNNNNIEINKLKLFGADDQDDVLEFIKYLKPKQIIYNPNGNDYQDCYYHMNYTPLFTPELNSNIEKIKIVSSDHVEPYHLSRVGELNNLQSLSVPILIHDLVKVFMSGSNISELENGCNHYGGLSNNRQTQQLEKDWYSMVDSITSSKSLRNLTISNFCLRGPECHEYIHIQKSILSDGIKKLFGQSSNIEYLKLVNMDFMSTLDTYEPLISNTKLKHLLLQYEGRRANDILEEDSLITPILNSIIDFLISKVFSTNQSIKHFKFFTVGSISHFFKRLLEYQDKLSLYSIELELHDKQFEDTLNFIKLFTKQPSTIKEFHLSFSNLSKQNKLLFKQKVSDFYKSNQSNHSIVINIFTRVKN